MPFEIAQPQIAVNPWVEVYPKEARALADLANHLRAVPDRMWDFSIVREESDCGTIGCAMGHACDVPSCASIGVRKIREGALHRKAYCVDEKPFCLPQNVRFKFFYESSSYPCSVTQFAVADRIDHWLATGEIR